MRKYLAPIVALLLVALFAGCGGFGGTYVNKESHRVGPGGGKTETLKITFHKDGTFEGYDDISGTWKLKDEQLTLTCETGGFAPGMCYTARVRKDRIVFDRAPNFVGMPGVAFTKSGWF